MRIPLVVEDCDGGSKNFTQSRFRRSFSVLNWQSPIDSTVMTSTCVRQCLRLPPPIRHALLRPRHLSTSPPPPSTFYLQRFQHSPEQYILLLPEPSLPMGRLSLSTLPPPTAPHIDGPIIAFIDPLPNDLIQESWPSFVENAGFRDVLQGVVRNHILDEEMVVNDARSIPGGEGWVHLCDERALPA